MFRKESSSVGGPRRWQSNIQGAVSRASEEAKMVPEPSKIKDQVHSRVFFDERRVKADLSESKTEYDYKEHIPWFLYSH